MEIKRRIDQLIAYVGAVLPDGKSEFIGNAVINIRLLDGQRGGSAHPGIGADKIGKITQVGVGAINQVGHYLRFPIGVSQHGLHQAQVEIIMGQVENAAFVHPGFGIIEIIEIIGVDITADREVALLCWWGLYHGWCGKGVGLGLHHSRSRQAGQKQEGEESFFHEENF